MAARERYTVDQVIKAIRRSRGLITHAARILRCNRSTVYDYARRHKRVQAAIDQENEVVLDDVEGLLLDVVYDPSHKDHLRAIRYYLRTKGRGRGFGDRLDVTSGGERLAPIELVVVNRQGATEDDGAGDDEG